MPILLPINDPNTPFESYTDVTALVDGLMGDLPSIIIFDFTPKKIKFKNKNDLKIIIEIDIEELWVKITNNHSLGREIKQYVENTWITSIGTLLKTRATAQANELRLEIMSYFE